MLTRLKKAVPWLWRVWYMCVVFVMGPPARYTHPHSQTRYPRLRRSPSLCPTRAAPQIESRRNVGEGGTDIRGGRFCPPPIVMSCQVHAWRRRHTSTTCPVIPCYYHRHGQRQT